MKEFIDGNEAIARAAIRAGCNFFAGYPITPATSILLHLSRELPKVGGIAIQGEDEIASIGFCIGAALVGCRVMTATSGPGISLYSENIGAAIMMEVPIVIVNVQRMGPATGAPTLGSYGDIQFVRWSNSGGYPVIVLAPTNVSECYNLTLVAFDFAERFRVPVFILTDKETGTTKVTVDDSSFKDMPVGRQKPFQGKEGNNQYRFNEQRDCSAFSPLGGPHLSRLTTSSHNSAGYLTKDQDAIRIHNEHLLAKIMDHRDEISLTKYDHQPEAEILIISYGITTGPAEEAVQRCHRQGIPISHLILHTLWPVPEIEIQMALKNANNVILPELNMGLYRREIERLVSDCHKIRSINRLDGSLISPDDIYKTVIAL